MFAYYTPEWVAAVGQAYNDNPDNQNEYFSDMTMFLVLGNVAQPEFGIDKAIYHSAHIVEGVLQDDITHISKEDAEEKADFILTGPLDVWKRIVKKEEGFVQAFMTGKIKPEKGEAPKIIALSSMAPHLADVFSSVETEWPDEMSPERLEEYRAKLNEYRSERGI